METGKVDLDVHISIRLGMRTLNLWHQLYLPVLFPLLKKSIGTISYFLLSAWSTGWQLPNSRDKVYNLIADPCPIVRLIYLSIKSLYADNYDLRQCYTNHDLSSGIRDTPRYKFGAQKNTVWYITKHPNTNRIGRTMLAVCSPRGGRTSSLVRYPRLEGDSETAEKALAELSRYVWERMVGNHQSQETFPSGPLPSSRTQQIKIKTVL